MLTPADPAIVLSRAEGDIAAISAYFKGARLRDFLASIEVLRESVALGGWVSRGHVRAHKGFGKGIASHKALSSPANTRRYNDPRCDVMYRCYRSAEFGSHLTEADIDAVTDDELVEIAPKVPVSTMRAWLRLVAAVSEICHDLDASRPAPVYTEIGLSRKVTATLEDARLDLDLSTRRMPPLGSRWVRAIDAQTKKPAVDHAGNPVMTKVYFPKWPDGTVFGTSRFAGCDCEACGKSIPSGLVVPVLVDDREGRPNGFWFGRDCARAILGIKDAGIEK